MCAIVGIHGESSPALLETMLSSVLHRGPDGQGTWRGPSHALGHARLSIIDIEGGAQPMSDAAGRRQVVFNGEIYNFRKLRDALGAHRFRTQSDTEVILKLAERYSDPLRWTPLLDGMFAIALVNGNGLTLARDPLGIKPLYVGRHAGGMVFASEIKALLNVAETIEEFPPGHVYTDRGGMQAYYRVPVPRLEITDADEARIGIHDRLEAAVVKRLIADVPVGVFLSGGLDSSMISALARQQKDVLDSFAVGTEDSDDLRRARDVAEFLGTRHHERLFTIPEAIKALPEVIYHLESFDCALVRSAIPNFFLARLAGEHVKVALSGEGADELFAGYEYLREIPLDQLDGELLRITRALHNTNLQRCDRMSMAHGLEVRVPFLDVAMVDYAFRIDPRLKQFGPDRTEKWVLRKTAERLLPHAIAWRKKSKFAIGCGLGTRLAEYAEHKITDATFERHRVIGPDFSLRSKEELLYYFVFREVFPREGLVPLVGRSRSV